MSTVSLTAVTPSYPFITERIQASVYAATDIARTTKIQSQIDSTVSHPSKIWRFTGLTKAEYILSIDIIDENGIELDNVTIIDVTPSDLDASLGASQADITRLETLITSNFAGTVDTLTFNPGAVANKIYMANAGAGDYTHFLRAPISPETDPQPINVTEVDGFVYFVGDVTAGFWKKVASLQSLINYYNKTDSDQLFAKRLASLTVKEVQDFINNIILVDSNNKISLKQNADGTWYLLGITEAIEDLVKRTFGNEGWEFIEGTDPDVLFGLMGSNKKLSVWLDSKERVHVPMLSLSNINKTSAFTDIIVDSETGQSVANSSESLPVITLTESEWGNLMFFKGIRTYDFSHTPENRPSSDFEVVLLKEGSSLADNGETGAVAFANAFKAKILGINSPINPKQSFPKVFCFFNAKGGLYLRVIDKRHNDALDPRSDPSQGNGNFYLTAIDDIKRAKAYADANGLSFSVMTVRIKQGEANNNQVLNDWDGPLDLETFIATYKADFINLKNDYLEDITIITKQFNRPIFLTYKTSGWVSGRAQFEAMLEDDEIIMTSTLYMLPNAENSRYMSGGVEVHGNWIHLSADGARWLAEQEAKVLRRVLLENEKWKPCYMKKSVSSSDRLSIFVDVNTPRPPLVIDTDYLSKSVDFGFQVKDGNGSIKAITGVEVINTNTIKISLAAALTASGNTITYGISKCHDVISQPIASVAAGSVLANGQNSTNFSFAGDIREEFRLASIDGVFVLFEEGSGTSSQATIRSITYNGSNTVLTAETRQVNGTHLTAGAVVRVYKWRGWGNVRDSDNERSLYKFANCANRTGYYPLWNWLLDFIEEPITII